MDVLRHWASMSLAELIEILPHIWSPFGHVSVFIPNAEGFAMVKNSNDDMPNLMVSNRVAGVSSR